MAKINACVSTRFSSRPLVDSNSSVFEFGSFRPYKIFGTFNKDISPWNSKNNFPLPLCIKSSSPVRMVLLRFVTCWFQLRPLSKSRSMFCRRVHDTGLLHPQANCLINNICGHKERARYLHDDDDDDDDDDRMLV